MSVDEKLKIMSIDPGIGESWAVETVFERSGEDNGAFVITSITIPVVSQEEVPVSIEVKLKVGDE